MSATTTSAPAPKKRKVAPKLADKIVQICSDASVMKDGLSQEILEQKLKQIPRATLLQTLNSLMSQGKLVACPGHDKKLVFRVQSDADAAKLQGLTGEDRLVLQEIERAGGQGASNKDLRVRCNMHLVALTASLKILETRKLVKQVKSVAAKGKKVYLLYDLEAGKELTGGSWYNGAEFDQEMVHCLQQAALSYIQREEGATAKQVHNFIVSSGIVRGKQLEIEDIESILMALKYDARLEESRDAYATRGEAVVYKVVSMDATYSNFTSVPCAVCPVFNDCCEGGEVSPQTCEYLTHWLQEAAELAW